MPKFKDALKDHNIAKEDINNEFNRRKKAGYQYNNGTIKVTEDNKGELYMIKKG